jgi:hypothetical protein
LPVDIKPGSCPNPLNVRDKGVLPVAILGTPELDLFAIDPASAQLAGVPPLRWDFEDVATPLVAGADGCECTTEGRDGLMDLTLKFDAQAIVAALGLVADGDVLPLLLSVNLLAEYGGGSIEGSDCVTILSKGKPE